MSICISLDTGSNQDPEHRFNAAPSGAEASSPWVRHHQFGMPLRLLDLPADDAGTKALLGLGNVVLTLHWVSRLRRAGLGSQLVVAYR